jgi:hypothetical protein
MWRLVALGTYGQIRDARQMRQVQLGLRFSF